ncbi:hypothetical protein BGZ79_005837 [Entomortierella chlamydospora]|nr:hypothetical protein BGZ79_005837 [Entomortierella chlamydospora]
MSRHSRIPSDAERDNFTPASGGLTRANPIKPQLAIPAMTKEAKESREQTQLWDVSLNKVFQNMHGDDTARFLSYFKARLEIEETYSRSLEKLAASAKGGSRNSNNNNNSNVSGGPGGAGGGSGGGGQGNGGNNSYIDPEEIPTTLRVALDALIDTTQQLHIGRRSFVKLLKTLTSALATLKESHEKQRKSHKETVKPVFQIYAETRLSTVPKLKRAYEQRCRDVEQVLSNEESDHLPVLEKLKNMTSSTGAAGRLLKCKRDMDEAGNEYKLAVQNLEVYRQKREQFYDSSFQAMQNMINERGTSCHNCLKAYVNGERDIMAKAKEDIDRLSTVVSCIKPSGDVDQISMTFVKDINSHPKQVHYENYYQKNAPVSIFGTSLTEYVRKYNHAIPLVVLKCSEAVDRSGLRREGIYRVSGRHAQIMKLKKQFEQNEESVDLTDPVYCDDSASIAAVLKIYLRELPEPLFPFPLNERIAYSAITDKNMRFGELRARLKRLPDCNIDTLQYLIQHLRRVYAHVEDNKMTLDNLSMIFTPAIFHDFNSAMVTGPQGGATAPGVGDTSLSFASTATSPSSGSPGLQTAPWSAFQPPDQQQSGQLSHQTTQPFFMPQNPTLGYGHGSGPSSPMMIPDPTSSPLSYPQAPGIVQNDQWGNPSSNMAAPKMNPASNIAGSAVTSTSSFTPPSNTVSAAASWSNDLVLADLILNSDTIFNVLPKIPSRSNTAMTIDDRVMAGTTSAFANTSLRPDPNNYAPGRSYSASRKSSSSSLGGNGATPASPTDSSGQLRPRMDSLGPNSSARTTPPVVSPTMGADQYQYHLPTPHQQQQYSYNDVRQAARANTPPSPSSSKGLTRSMSNMDMRQQQQQYQHQYQHQQQ